MFTHFKSKSNSGYTLLFAVIIATLVLGVGVFILSVSKEQYELSVLARDSMYAIYAADSGIECAAAASTAAYLDVTKFNGTDYVSQSATIECNGDTFFAPFVPFQTTSILSTDSQFGLWQTGSTLHRSDPLFIPFYDESGSATCAIITVYNGLDTTGRPTQRIESRGYNSCDVAAEEPRASTRTVERALRLTYKF